jgi:hypothetical protein
VPDGWADADGVLRYGFDGDLPSDQPWPTPRKKKDRVGGTVQASLRLK